MSITLSERDAVAAELAAYLTDTSSSSDPHQLFHRLRAMEPVHHSLLGIWIVSSYAEANAAFRHPALSREAAAQAQYRPLADAAETPDVLAAVNMFMATFLNRDEPDHTRLRQLVSRAFTPSAVAAWRPRVEAIVERLLDDLIEALDRGEDVDFMTRFAYPLPETVICELLGVPIEDHLLWRQWTAESGHAAVQTRSAGDDNPERAAIRARGGQAMVNITGYFRDLVRAKAGQSGDGLLPRLVEAEEAGDRLSEDELIGTLAVLVSAGHETTANLMGNGMLALLRHPDQFDLLRADPSKAPAAVEEFFRYETPSRSQPRQASADLELGGATIARGDQVMVILNAANRDPARFADPDRLDIDRRDPGHLAFGAGAHFCVGASLARLEAQVAFEAIARRLGPVRLAADEVRWRPTFLRALVELPVARPK